MRILVAEDDAVSRKLLEANLRRWGHDPVSCEDGTQAIAVLERPDTPRLAILDWMMPGGEGPEICRRARALPHGGFLYLILLTAKGEEEDMIQGLEAGADDYVMKPFSRNELRARLGVGLRVTDLQERLIQAERNRVVIQAAGAAAHEINQPLTVLMGTAEMMGMKQVGEEVREKQISAIYQSAERIRDIVQKMTEIRAYVTKPYLDGIDIIDFDAAASEGAASGAE